MYAFVSFPMQAFAHKMLVMETKVLLRNPNFLDSTDIFQCLISDTLGNAQRILYCGIILKEGWGHQHVWVGDSILPEENLCSP